jgi:hypothetical protein
VKDDLITAAAITDERKRIDPFPKTCFVFDWEGGAKCLLKKTLVTY